MFKLSKKADYGLIAVKHLAMRRNAHACSANEISEEYGISTTLMAKVLQKLARQVITSCVTSHGNCDATDKCSVREPLRRVNESILQVLGTVTISQMSEEHHEPALVELSSFPR
jgi:DNA-binding IscR family transcriptional regulator